ncbi:MAG: OmpA family protein [Hydrocarboniphaga sp.]|uniref:OmpA family protein n=1 Tax=Hydrocarboniphaga sp. TaxID=2033016 RepID=UPI00261E5886|nr:OmpA family protein [Hydrocarboniphaga sp.]MDB5969376.1 OmpA family protein [Hydrocarboniphaga sp.]
MKKFICRSALILVGMSLASVLWAQEDDAQPDAPFKTGPYLAPMASGIYSQTKRLDYGYGGILAAGYRLDTYAFEISGIYSNITSSDHDVREVGGSLNALWFPFSSSPNTFLIAEFGGVEVKHYPQANADELASIVTYAAGVGQLFEFNVGNYEFGLRAELLYRYGERDTDEKPSSDPDIAKSFKDVLVNVGLQLPLSAKPPVVAPVPGPVAVVPVAAPADSDGDGVPDDRDQCPGTPRGTVVNDVGCPLPPPCEPPKPGQRMDLSGCGVGDSIVLRGVNFEFDKATLTVNAKTLLDGVADALLAAPGIRFEVGGHTDSKGSDSYNQTLSESRASSVMQYLESRGVTADRMTSQGYGETQPVADNETDEGRELNRRVELKVTGAASSNAPAPADITAPVPPTGE